MTARHHAIEQRDPLEQRDGFRLDLEGLRAVAVVLVLLYHATVPGFPGGYVGVDVFFVLSGFLITRLLLREVEQTGTISLTAFYARRLRRLLPASALVLLVTVVASAALLPPLRVHDVTGDGTAAALYLSNVRFALEATDYLRADLAPSPLLHFWSLAVEEQFYLFWPAIVLLVTAGGGRARWRVGLAAVAISIASFGLSLAWTGTNAPWAFFSLPTRAWELGLGALLAVAAARLVRLPIPLAVAAGWLGLGLIGLGGIVLDAATPFPGTAALLPTVGAALVIVSGFRDSRFGPGRWLATRLPRFLGRISYSLYLWHWPLLVIPGAALDVRLPWWARGGLVLAAIGLAAATHRWVENPIRQGRVVGTLPGRNLAMAGALSLVVATVSLGLGSATSGALAAGGGSASAEQDEAVLDEILSAAESRGPVLRTPDPSGPWPSRSAAQPTPAPAASPASSTADGPVPAGLRPSLRGARTDYPAPYEDGCHVKETEVRSRNDCVYGARGSQTTVVVIGDSHAMSWFPALERLARERSWRLVNLTKSSCAVADLALWSPAYKRRYWECDEWREAAFRRIEAERPALVLMASNRLLRFLGPDGVTALSGEARMSAWREGMARSIERVTAAGARPVLIADPPRSVHDVPVCLSGHLDHVIECATPFDKAVDVRWLANEREVAGLTGAGFIDPTPWVCPTHPCPAVIGNYLVFRDKHHFATPFAAAIAPRLGRALDGFLSP